MGQDLMMEMREVFRLADLNGDDAIDARELQAALRVFGFDLNRDEILHVLAEFAKDGGSTIDFTEFVQMVLGRVLPPSASEDDALRLLRTSRVVASWSALFFEDDDMGTLCTRKISSVSKALHDGMTESELQSLLDVGGQAHALQASTSHGRAPPALPLPPLQAEATGKEQGHDAAHAAGRRHGQRKPTALVSASVRSMRRLLRRGHGAGHQDQHQRQSTALISLSYRSMRLIPARAGLQFALLRRRMQRQNRSGVKVLQRLGNLPVSRKVVQMTHWTISQVAVPLLRFKPASQVVAYVLQWPAVIAALRPLLSGPFLMTIFRHPRSHEALLTLLKSPRVETSILRLLTFDSALAHVCEQPDSPGLVGRVAGVEGLGVFFRNFILSAEPQQMRGFLRHRSTACFVAATVRDSRGGVNSAAAWVHSERPALAAAVARICCEPGAELWAMHFCRTDGIDQWLAAILQDPRGAAFCHNVMLQDGFLTRVDDFLGFEEAKQFVIRLLRRPGVCRFVTWLNRDPRMRSWFAQIASRENTMLFITEMLLEPGIDQYIVDLLLRRGNDDALRHMLDYWVHTEASFAEVFGSFSKKPGVEEALARVVISPGFLDGFVFQRFLWQPGLSELATEALTLVGVRGMMNNVVPLGIAVLGTAATLASEQMFSDVFADSIASLLTESRMLQLAGFLLGIGL